MSWTITHTITTPVVGGLPIIVTHNINPTSTGGGGGTSDHAALTHLAYADSGHTGFEPAKGTDDNFVTDAEKVIIGNTSGINTGDVPDVTVNQPSYSITVDLALPNQLSQRQLSGATEFAPESVGGITHHGFVHTYHLDLNSITPTFNASFVNNDILSTPDLTAGLVNIIYFWKTGVKYYYIWGTPYTGTISDTTAPTLSNFSISDSYPLRVYFNSSEVITASTFTGFAITGKTISAITINTGQTTGHYFTVTAAFIQGASATISYTSGSNLQDANGNALAAFGSTSITNNITNPSLSSATVENTTDNRLSMSFNEAVTITTVGWSVSATGGAVTVSSVSGSGTSTPYFVLNRSIAEAETVTVSYSGGVTTDLGGNQLATISTQAVTNNVTDLIPLDTPTNFVATVASSTQINLTWTDIANENSYELYRSTNNVDWTQIGGTIASGSTSYNATGLANGTLYYFRLRGIGTDPYDNSAYATDSESTVANAAPTYSTVTLNGTAQEGQTLSVTYSGYSDADVPPDAEGTPTIKYYKADTVGGTKTLVATASTYVLQSTDVNKYMYVGVIPVALTGTSPGTEIFSSASSQVTAAVTLPTDAVAYFPFSGNANDISGNGHNGTVTGATLTTGRLETSNEAYLFSGANTQYITLAGSTTLDPYTVGSISAWIYMTSSNYNYILSAEGGGNFWRFLFFNNLKLGVQSIIGSTNHSFQSDQDITLNAWHHAVIICNGTSWKLFIDNDEQVLVAASGNNSTNDGSFFNIGGTAKAYKIGAASFNGFPGKIDDVRIFNRALTANEVAGLYNE